MVSTMQRVYFSADNGQDLYIYEVLDHGVSQAVVHSLNSAPRWLKSPLREPSEARCPGDVPQTSFARIFA